MKNAKLALLGLSLAANAALGAWLLRSPAAPAGAPPATVPVSVPPPAPVDPLTQPVTAETWPQITALSDADYRQRLKREGLSPALIRSLLQARVAARYADRLKALESTGQDEYWRRSFRFPGSQSNLSPETRRERRALYREMGDEMKAIMGDDFELASPFERSRRERNFGNLPADKIAQIEAISADYQDLRGAVSEQTQGIILPEDRAQLRLLEQEQRADLAAVLTPEELLELDLRSSPSAQSLRMQLAFFEPTEEEYRALAQQRLAFDRQFGGNYLSEEEQARRRAAEGTLLEQARTVLSPERFADYELVSSQDFRNTAMALGRYNYDQTVAREVFKLRRDITARAAAVEAQSLYSAEQRAAELAALYREASAALTTRLGQPAAASFEREGAGNWLRKLKPQTAPGGSPR
ncbi:hypothetical protein ESB00_18190 [Oleiharenicola lentus]|uniref:Lipase modulator n=1 Tax=Oleiharenicola lentus TaxID=2508720 RepID=A0A4Q1C5C1_9BACT|nr:hypothetical protein [Oleiharenicola lentus]RXK53620.1 hypothetical protein ESB00_18190 [Oleiharenicola lentus]